MTLSFDNIITRFGDIVLSSESSSVHAMVVQQYNFYDVMKFLKESTEYRYLMLIDHLAVDNIERKVFELCYVLFSPQLNDKLIIKVNIPRDNPIISSLSSLWAIAQWQEREVFDLFGVLYQGHADLRRLFLDDDFQGYPLRKDYHDDFMLENEE